MAELLLISADERPLKPLVEAALANESRVLEASIRQTEQRLNEFEQRYQLPTHEFIRRYENDELAETLDFAEWIGEYRLLQRLRDKASTLRSISIAH